MPLIAYIDGSLALLLLILSIACLVLFFVSCRLSRNAKKAAHAFNQAQALQKRLELQIQRHATHDTLTGLPNRSVLIGLMQDRISETRRNQGLMAILLLDIDRFSMVNDIFGRSRGDEFLKVVALRLKKHLPKENTLGRIGGDEFLIVSGSLQNEEEVMVVINKMMAALEEHFYFYRHQLSLTCSIGVAYYPKDGDHVDRLLSNADVALSKVKKIGRNGFSFYTEGMNNYTLEYLQLENDLRHALARDEFHLAYQPIIDLSTMKAVGVEALIRWQHPTRGLVSPYQFVPLAEDLGIIREIGEWVMITACRQMKAWQRSANVSIKLSVNVSAMQFKFGLLANSVAKALEESGLAAEFLELELTEGLLIDGAADVSQTIAALTKLQVAISIDDFGTGYSSLNYLRRFDFDQLKIDKTFIKDLASNTDDQVLVKTIIAMASTLGLKVVAEGIETEEQLTFLKSLGCTMGQGYYLAKPMVADRCLQFLMNQ